jgi:hypothetical protein
MALIAVKFKYVTVVTIIRPPMMGHPFAISKDGDVLIC